MEPFPQTTDINHSVALGDGVDACLLMMPSTVILNDLNTMHNLPLFPEMSCIEDN